MKHILLFLIVFLEAMSVPAMAERAYLQPPEPVGFDKTQYFAKEYLADLEASRQKFQAYNATEILTQLDQLTHLFTEVEVLSVIADVKTAKETHDNLDLRADTDVTDSLKKLEDFVKYNYFYKVKPIDFEVDNINREYILSWVDENGDPVIKHIPFAPEMYVTVNGVLLQESVNGSIVYTYKYLINNEAQSKGAVDYLYLESHFSNTYFKGKYLPSIRINDSLVQRSWFPVGHKNYFEFCFFENHILFGIAPGVSMPSPFKLKEPSNTLPGTVHAYLSVYGYTPVDLIDYDNDPVAAHNIFITEEGSYTKHMYKGITIGPVPVPTNYNKADFIQTIIGYNQQAIDEGWVEDASVATYTTNTLQAIAVDPDNTAQINTFLSQIDVHYADGKLLSEAYALLKYNLEYLLSH